VLGLPAGAWVDRLPTRGLMIACDAVSALLYASLPAAAWIGALGTGQLVAVALLAGAVNVVFATAYQVCLPSLVTPAELVEGNARLQAGASVAAIGGRGLAGLAAQAVGAATALVFNAASFGVSAFCLLRIRPATPEPAARGSGRLGAQVWHGIRFVAGDPYLCPLTLYGAAANLAYAGNLALVVVFLVRVAGLRPAATGLLIAASGIGGVLGGLAAARLTRALGTARALVLSGLVSGLSGLVIPLAGPGPRAVCFVAGSGLVSGGIVVGNVIVRSFLQGYCPPSMLGRVTATMRVLAFGMTPLGALLAGALGTALGVRNGLWAVLGLFAASGSLLFTRCLRSVRDLPAASSAATSC
jgi:Major Facilitator Superfamily